MSSLWKVVGFLFDRMGSCIESGSTQFLSFKEGKVYTLWGKTVVGSKWILDHGSISVAGVKE